MKKDFDVWNTNKKEIEKGTPDFLYNEGEIWWCSVGLNIGEETCGKGDTFRRPILVIKKLSRKSCIGIPLSTQKKEGTRFAEISVQGESRFALLYQIRMFSTNRFQRRMASLELSQLNIVKEKLEALLELSNHHQDINPESVGNPKSNLIISDDKNIVN